MEYADLSGINDEQIGDSIYMFNSLPSYGKIKIKEGLYNKIQEEIPDTWDIIFVEDKKENTNKK